jgi:putative lipoprotein
MFVFACETERRFTVRVTNEMAWVVLPQGMVALPRVASPSGAQYSDGKITFWTKGDEARLETDVGVFRDCRSDPERAIWEEAKLRGIVFRAVGPEPGWLLEIDERLTRFIYNHGEERIIAPTPEPVRGPGSGMTYHVRSSEGRELTIRLEGRPCTDMMSGEKFETTVTVILESRELRGCGQSLQNVPPSKR